MDDDFYRILEVTPRASPEEIKKAFRRLARLYHPDVAGANRAAEERFKSITMAYEVLRDGRKRREYDQRRGADGPGAADAFRTYRAQSYRTGQSTARATASPDDSASANAHAESAPGNGSTGGAQQQRFNFQSIFENFIRGGADGKAPGGSPRPGQDVSTSLEIPFEMAVRGGRQKINVRMTAPGGKGQAPRAFSRDVTVRIPPGIRDGQKIRLAGAGQPGPNGGPSGSLYITVQVKPHQNFTREDADIHSTVEVDLKTAVAGGVATVTTIENPVTLKIPAGTQSGQTFKLRGLGGPKSDGGRGDHYATVSIRLPRHLTPTQQKLFMAFVNSLRDGQ